MKGSPQVKKAPKTKVSKKQKSYSRREVESIIPVFGKGKLSFSHWILVARITPEERIVSGRNTHFYSQSQVVWLKQKVKQHHPEFF